MKTAPSARSAGIDAVRVLGIGAVIFGHTFTGHLTHEFIYAWHVPVFFFLTGYLWKRGRTVGDEFVKRGRTLGLPYIGWFVVVSLLVAVDMARSGAVDLSFLGPSGYGGLSARGAFGTFWFVSTLFFAALLYRMIERLPRAVVWIVAIAGLAAGYLFGGWLASTPLAIGSALPCLIFLAVGTAAREVEPRIPRKPLVGLALIVLPLVVIALVQPEPIDIKQGLYGAPAVGVLFACAISFGLVLVAQAIPYPRVLGGLVTELAVVGIAVVLFHPYVLAYSRAHGLPAVGMFLAAVIVPWVVALLLHRTPLSALLIGFPRRAFRRVLDRV
ncbi:acyltransferase family protein [Leifsonia sp. ZF2019]|uniref:acyltransferase family protein n=1 Tax=Leifsonia sp. ZF2019 TaxID=2781978 RepID=UPI001CBBB6C8|nr:acyltransferase family protein [Leifsonia sp. ZF2019]UAJ81005.1 acyltransferase family protein [Leifsonia sp. ZF2019]